MGFKDAHKNAVALTWLEDKLTVSTTRADGTCQADEGLLMPDAAILLQKVGDLRAWFPWPNTHYVVAQLQKWQTLGPGDVASDRSHTMPEWIDCKTLHVVAAQGTERSCGITFRDDFGHRAILTRDGDALRYHQSSDGQQVPAFLSPDRSGPTQGEITRRSPRVREDAHTEA